MIPELPRVAVLGPDDPECRSWSLVARPTRRHLSGDERRHSSDNDVARSVGLVVVGVVDQARGLAVEAPGIAKLQKQVQILR